jgi:hypothetical protein
MLCSVLAWHFATSFEKNSWRLFLHRKAPGSIWSVYISTNKAAIRPSVDAYVVPFSFSPSNFQTINPQSYPSRYGVWTNRNQFRGATLNPMARSLKKTHGDWKGRPQGWRRRRSARPDICIQPPACACPEFSAAGCIQPMRVRFLEEADDASPICRCRAIPICRCRSRRRGGRCVSHPTLPLEENRRRRGHLLPEENTEDSHADCRPLRRAASQVK